MRQNRLFLFFNGKGRGNMGTTQTRQAKINKIRRMLEKAGEKDRGISKDQLIAVMMMEGTSKKNIQEIIQSFIDIGEAEEKFVEGEIKIFLSK